MKMKHKYTQHTALLFWFVCMLVSVAAAGFLWWHIFDLAEKAQQTQESIHEQEIRQNMAKETEARILQLQDHLEMLRAGFADPENPLPLLRSIESMRDVLPVSVVVTEVREANDALVYELHVTINGSYAAVYDAMWLLQTSPYVFEIQSFLLEQVNAAGEWRGSVNLFAPKKYGEDVEKL